ncbi:ABC transporter substrate-binding protein [Halopseudomonas laoshanensis]|uniref:ABC transporter substrate-binding protein n=1 Tax=Halopseudomonas laoshanensis TaxID=2268758 RepID=A0A7V7GSY3_9GAMM|nr:ABC transporter substrate-binding protein [Halopseudomonas laoshanensis]KAA0694118.1 ABC transporter substrate-binding protein [Halopseudomonas laoshanensis]
MLKNTFKVLAITLAIAGSGLATAADKVTYQLDWLPGGDKAPVYVGIQQGFFADEDLEVSIASGRGSTDAITKIATGQADLGSADIGALMAARAQEDVPVSAIYTIFNQAPHAFFMLSTSDIKSITDIQGKKVATSPFTSSNAFLPLVLKENGMPEDAVTLTKSDPGALGPMLITGNTDAIIAWVTNVALFQDQAASAGKEIRVLPWSDAGLSLYSSAVVASDSFLEERPDVAKRFMKAYAKSLEFTMANPEAAAEDLHTMVPEVDPAVAVGQINDTKVLIDNEISAADGVGALTPERVASTWEWVAQANDLSTDSLDPETIINRGFMPESK